MAYSKFRNDFRRAVMRTTASIFLPAALLATPLAAISAQQSAFATDTPPAATEVVQQAEAKPIVLQNGTVVPVDLTEVQDTETLLQERPYLAEQVKAIQDMDKEIDRTTTFSIATAQDPATNTQMVFLYADGVMTCGSIGCTLSIYTDSGNGFEQNFSANTPRPFYVGKNDAGEISTFFCSDNRKAEWGLKDGQFEIKEKPASPMVSGKPLCARP